jgi:hypothetical protein
MTLPSIPTLKTIQDRLPLIFPEGVENRTYCIRESTAKTILVMLYAGAVDKTSRWIRPSQVTDMSDTQLALASDAEREAWCKLMLSSKKDRPFDAWYKTNSREQVRDENLRQGLIPNGAALERSNLPTTTSLPKYSLDVEFAALFADSLSDSALDAVIDAWQKGHLSKAARSRVVLVKKGASAASGRVSVKLPNGTSINLSAGPSSVIAKAVIEQFAQKFLQSPALLWVSESAVKVLDADLVQSLKLKIDPAKHLPDIILVDVEAPEGILVVFVEVVHSDGPVNQLRKEALAALAVEAGFSPEHVAYVTAYGDRDAGAYRATAPNLAWDTFVWFASEPDCVVRLKRGSEKKLTELR